MAGGAKFRAGQALAVATKDLRVARRDQVASYVLASSLILAGAARLFLPVLEDMKVTYAVAEGAPPRLVERLRAQGRVELFADEAAVRGRVAELDDVPGVVVDGEGPLLVVEGNEQAAVREAAIAALAADALDAAGVEVAVAVESVGRRGPRVRSILLALTLYAGIVLIGAAMGMTIVDEKEGGTVMALRVTPLRLREYLAAKLGVVAALGLGLAPLAALVALGGEAPIGAVMVAALGVLPIAWLFGLVIGAAASTQLAAMSALKAMLLVLVSAPVIGFLDLGGWERALVPFGPHWGVQAMHAALTGAPMWPALWATLTTLPLVAAVTLVLARQLGLGDGRSGARARARGGAAAP